MIAATRVEDIPPITRKEAEGLARTEHARYVDQLRELSSADWSKQTECPLWDVRAMAGHSVGMMSDFTSFRKLMGRMSAAGKAAKKSGQEMVDEMTAMQVADNADLTTDELLAKGAEVGLKAARWRAKAPALFRLMPMKEVVDGKTETWKMGYLLDVILTRDPWTHRGDIARATGRDMVLTPEHDGRIVADVVAEWSRRHGQPFALTLTGPAGGQYISGDGGEQITMDVIEFCRILSGRAEGTGLLSWHVPF